jgi:acetolactate decarboxylase
VRQSFRHFRLFHWTSFTAVLLINCALAQTASDIRHDLIYQVSTLPALSSGVFDGDVTIADLTRYGDFGLGTFNGVDGEMIVLNGNVYQVKADGVARIAEASTQTPFALVTPFKADITAAIDTSMTCKELENLLDTLLPSKNTFYALKVEGRFQSLVVRSEARQQPPYPTLSEVLADQIVFDLGQTSGTMVGFWFPEYAEGVNLPGYHFHVVSADRNRGGHVLDCRVQQADISIDISDQLTVDLPEDRAFLEAELSK